MQTRWPGDGRLVALYGRLPLAVQIAAALLDDEPERPLAVLARELADEGGRLRALDYGPRWAVRAAFDLSRRRLDEPVARLFRLLAAVPGTDIGLAVAAVVADRPEGEVRAGLRALCRAHLVLRHSCAMSLLQTGVDASVIALWLGHASVRSTDAYLHADITIKEKALALTAPAAAPAGRYRPPDKVLAFLESL